MKINLDKRKNRLILIGIPLLLIIIFSISPIFLKIESIEQMIIMILDIIFYILFLINMVIIIIYDNKKIKNLKF